MGRQSCFYFMLIRGYFLFICLFVNWEWMEPTWYPRGSLTNKQLSWNPNSTDYEDQNNAMSDFCVKTFLKDPAVRVSLVVINQVTVSTCTEAAGFTSDVNIYIMHLSNVTIFFNEIFNSETRYGNIRSKNTKQFYSQTLAKRWNIDLWRSRRLWPERRNAESKYICIQLIIGCYITSICLTVFMLTLSIMGLCLSGWINMYNHIAIAMAVAAALLWRRKVSLVTRCP